MKRNERLIAMNLLMMAVSGGFVAYDFLLVGISWLTLIPAFLTLAGFLSSVKLTGQLPGKPEVPLIDYAVNRLLPIGYFARMFYTPQPDFALGYNPKGLFDPAPDFETVGPKLIEEPKPKTEETTGVVVRCIPNIKTVRLSVKVKNPKR